MPLPVVMGSSTGWRTLAKLAVRGTPSDPLVGLFRRGTHVVEPVGQCSVHHPAINDAIRCLVASIRTTGVHPYDENRGRGTVRYVQCAVERTSGLVQMVLVCNMAACDENEVPPALMGLADKLMDHGSLHSVWLHFNDEQRNNIFSFKRAPHPRWLLLRGQAAVRETIGRCEFNFPPYVFRQANLEAFEVITSVVAASVPQGARVTELFSGIGVLGLNCAHRAEWVRCSDSNPLLLAAVEATMARLPASLRESVSYSVVDASDSLEQLVGADTLIVDPPRKGLPPSLLESLCDARATSIATLIYVSCGYAALEVEAKKLVDSGWHCERACAHVLFPGADHIETVVVFTRQLVT